MRRLRIQSARGSERRRNVWLFYATAGLVRSRWMQTIRYLSVPTTCYDDARVQNTPRVKHDHGRTLGGAQSCRRCDPPLLCKLAPPKPIDLFLSIKFVDTFLSLYSYIKHIITTKVSSENQILILPRAWFRHSDIVYS